MIESGRRVAFSHHGQIHTFSDRQENQPDTERSRDKTLWPQRDGEKKPVWA